MSHADEVPDVDVGRADQQMINLFGRLNNKKHVVSDEIAKLKEKLQNYEDAQAEMMFLDDGDDVKYAIGDTFSMFDTDSATEMLEAEMEGLQQKMEGQKELMASIEDEMSGLKTKLYAKFGKSINLEENPDA